MHCPGWFIESNWSAAVGGTQQPTVDSCIIFDAAHLANLANTLELARMCGKAYFSARMNLGIVRLVCEILNAVGERWNLVTFHHR